MKSVSTLVLLAILTGLLLCFAGVARAQVVISDGDSLRINNLKIRLWAIDAPELDQTCANGFEAGQYAKAVLTGLLQARQLVYCAPRGSDRYGRTLATCFADGLDVGAELVRQGLAWNYTRYSGDTYALQEKFARDRRLGIHGAGCVPAWEWRRKEKR